MNRYYPRTVSAYRRDLLAALRKIRDEGPVNRNAGISTNAKLMMRANRQECIWTHHLYNQCMRRVGDPYGSTMPKWKNPTTLQILHRMIQHLENNHFYLGTDL